MINGFLAQWVEHGKLFANAHCGRIFNFAVAGNRARPLNILVVINGVFGAFAKEKTPVLFYSRGATNLNRDST